MRDYGGFEGNGQTLRILSKLENFSKNAGANLCRRTLLGVFKYPASFSRTNNKTPKLNKSEGIIKLLDVENSKPPKCYLDSEQSIVDWILEPLSKKEKKIFQAIKKQKDDHHKTEYKSFDCSIMDIADDISYCVHDLEDAIAMRLVSREQFENAIKPKNCKSFLDALKEKYSKQCGNDVYAYFVNMLFGSSGERKRCVSRLVHHFITAVEIKKHNQFKILLLDYYIQLKNDQKCFLDALKEFVFKKVICNPTVQHLEFKGQRMVVSVFEAMASDPERLLPIDVLEKYKKYKNSDTRRYRIICDYIAGMTDMHLLKIYERLFSPRMGSVFDKL